MGQFGDSGSGDYLADLKRWSDMIKGLPEPIAYIVLDPNWSPMLPHVDGHDAQGRRYVVASPAVLDEMEHRKPGPVDLMREMTDFKLMAARLSAIPIYRRQDMPEGWPDA